MPFRYWQQLTELSLSFATLIKLSAFLHQDSYVRFLQRIPFSFSDILDWKQGAFKAEAVSGTAGKVLGFWDCCSLAMFCYSGSDVVAMAAHESEFQQRDLPKAVRRISTRLIRYYAAIILILGLTVSSSDPMLLLPTEGFQIYPGGFVVMAIRAGLPVVASLINAAQITATISYATGDLYIVVLSLEFSLYSLPPNLDPANVYETRAVVFQPCQTWTTSGIDTVRYRRSSDRQKILFPWPLEGEEISMFHGFP